MTTNRFLPYRRSGKQWYTGTLLVLALLGFAQCQHQPTQNPHEVDEASPITEETPAEEVPAPLSAEELQNQFDEIVDQYLDEEFWPKTKGQHFSESDKQKLYTLYQQMAPEQQANQRVKPYRRKDLALEKRVPSPSQWAEWSSSNRYGIWVDGLQVDATRVAQYTPDDFAFYRVSRLLPNAKNAYRHDYQLDLMTQSYFEASNTKNPNEILVGVLQDPRRLMEKSGA
ncbi:MAG TPA: hypothetical protein DCE41_23240 [Cytophagales bacterium]|nr:hypothetical protein [Cytophagales bacterium]HAA21772.1 hypothetical protein [Cytophagales bacterium]HAP60068.1 hypothetical protein [Cytophagales bacterium]